MWNHVPSLTSYEVYLLFSIWTGTLCNLHNVLKRSHIYDDMLLARNTCSVLNAMYT